MKIYKFLSKLKFDYLLDVKCVLHRAHNILGTGESVALNGLGVGGGQIGARHTNHRGIEIVECRSYANKNGNVVVNESMRD